MAGKATKKSGQKANDKSAYNRSQSNLPDELDLRDEIFELKKEIAALRKERNKLLIRIRKSEDESKRKDKQIEQLMDPAQNSEIRRLLSMKGAALLLNLKDQNNSLVHLLMDKDQQIRRMVSEVKTAKLYSRSSKTEPYRAEIARLRTLLLQSQEAIKEAAAGPQISSSLLPTDSSSSSSSQPTPRQLEELRFTIESLETHMRYSKELLNKKNHEINSLSQQLEKFLHGQQPSIKPQAYDYMKNYVPDYNEQTVFDNSQERRKLLELFRKPLPKAIEKALTEPKLNKPAQVSKRNSLPCLYHEANKLESAAGKNVSINEQKFAGKLLTKSLKWKSGKCEKSLPSVEESTTHTGNGKCYDTKRKKEKWRNAVKKLRKMGKGKNEMETDDLKMEKTDGVFEENGKKRVVNNSVSDEEVWNVIRDAIRQKSFDDIEVKETPLISRKLSLPVCLDETGRIQSALEMREFVRQAKMVDVMKDLTGESDEIILVEESPEILSEEIQPKMFRALYRGSIDSSFESETGSIAQPKSFQVEVEINNPRVSVSLESDGSTPVRDSLRKVGGETFLADDFFDEDDDDDNDVVTI